MIKLMDKYFDVYAPKSMEDLLSAMEKVGMMPPRNPNIIFEQQVEHKTLHIWEEEPIINNTTLQYIGKQTDTFYQCEACERGCSEGLKGHYYCLRCGRKVEYNL